MQTATATARTGTTTNDNLASLTGADKLRVYIERIERLHEERKALSSDISDVYKELKGQGFDAKAVREVVKLRGMDPDLLAEYENTLEMYRKIAGV